MRFWALQTTASKWGGYAVFQTMPPADSRSSASLRVFLLSHVRPPRLVVRPRRWREFTKAAATAEDGGKTAKIYVESTLGWRVRGLWQTCAQGISGSSRNMWDADKVTSVCNRWISC